MLDCNSFSTLAMVNVFFFFFIIFEHDAEFTVTIPQFVIVVENSVKSGPSMLGKHSIIFECTAAKAAKATNGNNTRRRRKFNKQFTEPWGVLPDRPHIIIHM